MTAPRILFIDAATYFGWAFGEAGQPPVSGSRYFAKGAGASMHAVFAGALRWTTSFIMEHGKDISIRIEAPLPTSLVEGKTTIETTQILMGLPAVIEAAAYNLGCFDVDRVLIQSIRKHFIGKNMRGDIAKPRVMQKCIALGWISMGDGDMSHDRSDACAGWSYCEHQLAPKISQPIDDLFVKAKGRRV